MSVTRLGPGAEFDRIRAILQELDSRAAGVGDDAALIADAPGQLLISTDLSVEDVHFRRAWMSAEEIGWRAAAASLSDLAAMGAEVTGVLASVALPRGEPPEAAVALMRGVGEVVTEHGGRVLGGDLTSAPVWLVDVVALGRATRPVSRSGARSGDSVWVSGRLGGAHAAFAAWQDGREPDARAREAFTHPRPRVALGRWLAAEGATAMLDLSDGLAGDAAHLAAASGVRIDIALDLLPLHPSVRAEASRAAEPPARFAARGGEDYELLATLPAGFGTADAARCAAVSGVALTRIGAVSEGAGLTLTLDGAPMRLSGFDHFA